MTGSETDVSPQRVRAVQRRAITAAVIGNTLEWYDFVVYAFLAGTIAKLFFPASDPATGLLLAFATFGVGFVMRPIGALVLGSYADRAGRRKALMVTILLMGLGTAMIGFAPSYNSIGWWAGAIVVLARLVQGFSAGGELGSATAFMMEHVPDRPGLAASWQQASQAATLLLGSLVGASISGGLLSSQDLESWGWRVPFLLGLLIVPVGVYIRYGIEETPAFLQRKSSERVQPLRDLLRSHGQQLLAGLGLVVVWTVSTYFFLIYLPTYAVRQLGLPQSSALLANSAALVVMMCIVPLAGWWSDKIGRKPLLLAGATGICALSYPLIAFLAAAPSLGALIAVQVIMAALIGLFTGPAPAALGELFPTEVRSSGMSVAYNAAVAVFGGFAPFIATWLIGHTGSNLAPAGYVTIAALLSLVALYLMKERAEKR